MSQRMCSLSQLGGEYRPDISMDAARKMMIKMIDDTKGLKDALNAVGWNGRTVTPKIREVFYRFLGAP